METTASQNIVTHEDLFILNERTGKIDLSRSVKDYLDLRDELQRSVRQTDGESFAIDHETHVVPTVEYAYKYLKESKEENPDSDGYLQATELPNGKVLYFSFGLPKGMQGFTLSDEEE
jgi:hypothetical protein